jgi:hypothetical protein
MPKIDALSPLAEPVEKALRQLPLPKPTIQLTYFDIMGVAEKIRCGLRSRAVPSRPPCIGIALSRGGPRAAERCGPGVVRAENYHL